MRTTQKLAFTSIMIAITIILTFTPLGMIRLPLISFTIAHIPTIVAAIVLGLSPGIIVGFSFGLSTLIVAATAPTGILDPFFVNPLVSILPRVIIPITTYFAYKLLRLKFKNQITSIVPVFVGTFTNTLMVFAMLYIVYAKQILEKAGTSVKAIFITVLTTNAAIECVATIIICVPIILALKKFGFSQQ